MGTVRPVTCASLLQLESPAISPPFSTYLVSTTPFKSAEQVIATPLLSHGCHISPRPRRKPFRRDSRSVHQPQLEPSSHLQIAIAECRMSDGIAHCENTLTIPSPFSLSQPPLLRILTSQLQQGIHYEARHAVSHSAAPGAAAMALETANGANAVSECRCCSSGHTELSTRTALASRTHQGCEALLRFPHGQLSPAARLPPHIRH